MKKHRIAAVSAASALIFSAFTGCGTASPDKLLDPKNPVTLTIWHYYNGVQQTSFDEMITEFNNTMGLEKGIIAEGISKSSISELADSVTAAVNKEAGADDPPDIFAVYSETAFKLDKMGVLADMKTYLTDEELAEYVPEYISEGTFSDGSLKIFPTAKSTEVMMLNKTDWDKFAAEYGLTENDLATVEGVVSAGEKYYQYTDGLTPDIPNDGKAFFGRDSAANYMFIGAKQLGFEFVTDEGSGNMTVTADKDGVRKLWDNYYVPFVKGYFAAESRYRSDDAKTGTIISLVCSTTGTAYFPDEVTVNEESYPIENMIVPVPHFDGADNYIVQQGAGMSMISSDAASEYAGIIFLKWFTENERNTEFAVTSGYMPVKTSAATVDNITAANNALETPVNDVLFRTMKTAIEETGSAKLYTTAPFDRSAETRDYIGSAISDTAAAAHEEAAARIAAGEDRETVLGEYTDDNAFESWYSDFITGLEAVITG